MGIAPRDVDRMHLSEWVAAVRAHNRASGAEEPIKPPTAEEHDALVAKYG